MIRTDTLLCFRARPRSSDELRATAKLESKGENKMTQKMITCLWVEHGKAREAAECYAATLPNSHVGRIMAAPTDTPSAPEGQELFVEFTVCGGDFLGLNGGPKFLPNETDDEDSADPVHGRADANPAEADRDVLRSADRDRDNPEPENGEFTVPRLGKLVKAQGAARMAEIRSRASRSRSRPRRP